MNMKKIFSALMALAVLTVASCVNDDIYGIPVVSGVEQNYPLTETEPATISVKASSLVGIETVELFYIVAEKLESMTMALNGDVYEATVPAQALGTVVKYYVVLKSKSGDSKQTDMMEYEVGNPPIDYTGLVLNELNGNDKFIELYNGSENELNIRNIKILKDAEQKLVWTAPDMKLAAGEYLLLYSEDVTTKPEDGVNKYPDHPTDLIFASGLSAKKAVRITLVKPNGITIIDDFNYANHPGSKISGSYGRNADGKWYQEQEATPGIENIDGSVEITGLE